MGCYLMRYGARNVKWTKSELDEIDRKTRKVMAMDKELHPKSDIDCFMYLEWKEEED